MPRTLLDIASTLLRGIVVVPPWLPIAFLGVVVTLVIAYYLVRRQPTGRPRLSVRSGA